jgi:hypothetical protein
VTASEDHLSSLRNSAERIVNSLTTLTTRVVTDPHVTGAANCVQREVRQAKAVGQFAVLTASAKIKQFVQHDLDEVSRSNGSTPASDEPLVIVAPPSGIPEYANLSAAQIVPLLRALNEDERIEVLRYETATRQRKTIIAALDKPVA